MHNPGEIPVPRAHASSLAGRKILSIYYQHKPGGFCKRLYMMFDALVKAGAEVHYIAVAPYPVSHPKIIPHILPVPFRNKEGLLFWAYFILIVPFYAFVVGRREGIDLVSVFGGLYGFSAVLLKVLAEKPILAFARGDAYEIGRMLRRPQLFLFLEDAIVRLGFKWSDRIVAVSPQLKERIACRYRIGADRITVLQNNISDFSVDTSVRETYREKRGLRGKLGLDGNIFIIMTMSVFDASKNIGTLIQSAAFLKQPAVFLMVGDGPERRALQRQAARVAGDTKIVFTGWQAEVSDFLKAADLFVLPSKHEGCSNALLEALAQGLPCLGSDIPENRAVLKSDQLLFDPLDAKGLSDKINGIMLDRNNLEKMKALSEQARKRLVFDWDRNIVQCHACFFDE